jgi:flagellar basal-body rod modification protein FlgD
MSAISTTDVFGATTVRERTRGFSEISSEQFVALMMSELTNQDPLKPNDTEQLLNQIATIRSIESDESMLDALKSVTDSSEFASAANLIGTLVSGVTEDGRRAVDVVLSVSRTSEGPVLNLFDGSRVKFSKVDEVVAPLDRVPDDGGDA